MTIPLRVLILEDRPSDAELILAQLKREGLDLISQRVDTRADFLAALSGPFDLILADYSLPGFSGLDAIRLLKERGLDIPVILVSGTIGEEEAVLAIKEGAHDYLLKGKLTRLGSAVRNALEEKRLRDAERAASQALNESETRFRSLVENSSDEISIIAADGALLYESPSANPTLGYRSGEFLGKSLFQLIHPDDLERVQERFAQLVGNPDLHPREQFRLRHRDGNWRWVEAVGTNLLNEPAVRGIVVNYHDITERKQASLVQEILYQVLREVSRQLDLDLVAHSAVETLVRLTGYPHVCVALPDENGAHWVVRGAAGSLAAELGATYPIHQGVIGRAFKTGQAQWVRDILDDPDYVRDVSAADAPALRSEVVALMRRGEQVLGALNIESDRVNAFNSADVRMTESVAEVIGLALQNARLYKEAQQEITERKQAEEALRLRESYLTAILENQPGLVWLKDTDSRFLTVNQAFADSCGKASPADLAGKTDLDIWPKELAEKYRADDAGVIRNKIPVVVEEPIFDRGKTTWFETFKTPIFDDKGVVIGTTGYSRDITERRRAEEALRESETRFRSLVENSSDEISIIAADGALLYESPSANPTLGYRNGEFLGKSLFQLVHPDDLERVQERFAQLVRNPDLHPREQFRLRHRDGTWRWVEAVGTNLLNEPAVRGIVVNYHNVTARRQAEERIQRQIEYLTALREIDQAIVSSFDVRISLNFLVSKAIDLLAVDAVAVLLVNAAMNALEFAAGLGFRTNVRKTARIKLGESYAGKVALGRRLVQIPNLMDQPDNLFAAGISEEENFTSYYGAPLIVKGKVMGVLETFHRSIVERDQEWLDLFSALAGQAAIAIENADLFGNLQTSNINLRSAYDATIEGWSRALDLRDKETEGHTQRVTEMTMRLATAMGLGDAEILHIRRGALLHDIGKMGVPDHILFKGESLTEEEWVMMRRHPQFAYDMLLPITFLHPSLDIPYCHHEKWDGSGYPRGLEGDQIPLAARLFAVVDVWDALTSDRPYRKAWSRKKTIQHIKEQSGKHFDPRVVEIFLNEFGSE